MAKARQLAQQDLFHDQIVGACENARNLSHARRRLALCLRMAWRAESNPESPDHATGHAARRGAGLVVFLADRPFKNSSCLESRLTATGAEMVGPIAPRSRAHVPSAWTACPMRSGGTLHARGIAVRMFCVLTTYG